MAPLAMRPSPSPRPSITAPAPVAPPCSAHRPARPHRFDLVATLATLAILTWTTALGGHPELPGIHPAPDSGLFWDTLLTLRTAGGHKQNAILSPFNPQDTPLLTGGIEYFASRLPMDGHGFTLFVSADERRYLDPVEIAPATPVIRGERTVLSQASYKWYGRTWVPTLAFTHLHAEQAFDATEIASDPGSIRAVGDSLILAPALRYRFPAHLYVEASFPVNRQLFRSPVSSHWEFGPKTLVGLAYATDSAVELSFQDIQRPFDTRRQTDPLGQPLNDTLLTTHDLRYEVSWRHTWNHAHKLQTTLRAFHVTRADNGAGYSDYTRQGAAVAARFEAGQWAFRSQARWSTYDFNLQIVSVFDPVPRTRVETDVEARLEYRWTPRLRTYAEYFHERQDSNVAADRYRSHTALGGVEVDF